MQKMANLMTMMTKNNLNVEKIKCLKVKRFNRTFAFLLFTFYLTFSLACYVDKNRFEVATPTPETPKVKTLADDLKFIENANFKYVYVFRRIDGEKFSSEDIDYLKYNAHPSTNQWLKSEESKTIIAGSNFQFNKQMIDNLSKRFKVEDLSPKVEQTEQNTNINR